MILFLAINAVLLTEHNLTTSTAKIKLRTTDKIDNNDFLINATINSTKITPKQKNTGNKTPPANHPQNTTLVHKIQQKSNFNSTTTKQNTTLIQTSPNPRNTTTETSTTTTKLENSTKPTVYQQKVTFNSTKINVATPTLKSKETTSTESPTKNKSDTTIPQTTNITSPSITETTRSSPQTTTLTSPTIFPSKTTQKQLINSGTPSTVDTKLTDTTKNLSTANYSQQQTVTDQNIPLNTIAANTTISNRTKYQPTTKFSGTSPTVVSISTSNTTNNPPVTNSTEINPPMNTPSTNVTKFNSMEPTKIPHVINQSTTSDIHKSTVTTSISLNATQNPGITHQLASLEVSPLSRIPREYVIIGVSLLAAVCSGIMFMCGAFWKKMTKFLSAKGHYNPRRVENEFGDVGTRIVFARRERLV